MLRDVTGGYGQLRIVTDGFGTHKVTERLRDVTGGCGCLRDVTGEYRCGYGRFREVAICDSLLHFFFLCFTGTAIQKEQEPNA